MTENVLGAMTAQDHLCFECDEPHDFRYIDPRCHPQVSIQAAYSPLTKLLRIECSECGREVVTVRVNDSGG
jgi:hypothetical protein